MASTPLDSRNDFSDRDLSMPHRGAARVGSAADGGRDLRMGTCKHEVENLKSLFGSHGTSTSSTATGRGQAAPVGTV